MFLRNFREERVCHRRIGIDDFRVKALRRKCPPEVVRRIAEMRAIQAGEKCGRARRKLRGGLRDILVHPRVNFG